MTRTFDKLDRRDNNRNFVKLADMRDELSSVSRSQFDASLNKLRREGVLTLDSFEGNFQSLTKRDKDAAIREGQSLLVFVSRR